MNVIQELLHETFSDNAINFAAICEQLEDISYCSEHGMNHLNGNKEAAKWNAEMKKAETYYVKDDSTTFNKTNIKRFKKNVKKIISENPKINLYHGLSIKEKYAFRFFYYYHIY